MLIGLYSPVMQSGKTTVANTLRLEHDFALVKFADPFKAAVVEYLVNGGAPREVAEKMVEDGALKERIIPSLGVSTRQLLQGQGSWGRAIHPDFWVSQAVPRIKRYLAAGVPVVVDDLRFPNEYEAIIRLGGMPVRVYREGTQAYTAHPSEGLLESYPMTTINNNGSVEQLRACARGLPELWRGQA